MVTHIIIKDGKEIGRLPPNMFPEVALKKFKDMVKKNDFSEVQ